jgi:SAM-dependent methyltransferase
MLAGFSGYPGPRQPARALLWPLWPFWRVSSEYARVISWTGEGRLLDFGCGAGQFLARMKSLGWTAAGLELSPDAIAECRAAGLEVRLGTFPDASIPDAAFDVVTFWESLEHVPNPRETVAEARRILTPGGRVVLSLPLCDSLAFERLGADWYSLDLPRHLSHFTRNTLERLLREQGFEEVQFRARRTPHVWQFSFARRFASRCRRLDEWLSRSRRTCALIELAACITRRPGAVVVLARKPLRV